MIDDAPLVPAFLKLEVSPDEKQLLLEAAFLLVDLQDYAAAADVYRGLLEICTDTAPVHFHLAHVLALLGDRPRAIEHLDESIHLRPGWVRPVEMLAHVLSLSGRIEEAHVCAERVRFLNFQIHEVTS